MEMSWSRWFRCESSFELLLVPKQPGVFAIAEEMMEPSSEGSRRMLAVFAVDETEDLARDLSRMFASGSPWQQKLNQASCFVRYAVTSDQEKRHAAANALRHWLDSKRDAAAQVFGAAPAVSEPHVAATQLASVAAGADDSEDDDENDGVVKTTAERAVDRVAKGVGYANVFKT